MEEQFMHRCLELARLGTPSPNPRVGAVVVHNGQIIGEAFHRNAGQPHAEALAINAVKEKHLHLLAEAILYVNLEPCAHFGKTPPCADLIIKKGIKKVVFANSDPNEQVEGHGSEKLKHAGVDVEEGVLQKEGEWVNRRYFTYHRYQRPYVILKWAQSEDGFMDFVRGPHETGVRWLTSTPAKRLVHAWRAREDAIMIGAHTALSDSPALTVREVTGKNPVRVVMDPKGSWQPRGHLASDEARTVHLTAQKTTHQGKTSVENRILEPDIPQTLAALKTLYTAGIQSVLVEGGAYTLNRLIEEGLWDEARILTAPLQLGAGLNARQIKGKVINRYSIGPDSVKILVRS